MVQSSGDKAGLHLERGFPMPTFLSDPPTAVYLALALAVIVTGYLWFTRRERKSTLAFAVSLALFGLIGLLDYLFESPREESVRRVQEMIGAANARNREAFVSHIAERFEYEGEGAEAKKTITRDQLLRSGFWDVLAHFNVTVAAWGFDRSDVKLISDETIEIGFLASGKAEGKQIPLYFRARFTRQPDGQMKLTNLASYDPIQGVRERRGIPNFP
jgi:hypothetical protein